MVYKINEKDDKYTIYKELTKNEDPAILADVGSNQVVFMLSDGTLKYHGLTMPPIQANDQKSDFAESFTIAKLEKDKVKEIHAGGFGDIVILDTDNKLYGIEIQQGLSEIFMPKDEWASLNG